MAALKWVVVHHTDASDARPTVQAIASYHTGPTAQLDFPEIAYTVYVEGDGRAYLCHDLTTVTWGQGDGSPGVKDGVGTNNWCGIAVCFAGNNPTEAQLVKLREVCDYIETQVGHSLVRLGHKDVSRSAAGQPLTECPGALYPQWIGRLR